MSLPSRQVDAEVGMCVASAATIVPRHDSPERRPNMCFWHRHCAIYARARWRQNCSVILFGYLGKYQSIQYLARMKVSNIFGSSNGIAVMAAQHGRSQILRSTATVSSVWQDKVGSESSGRTNESINWHPWHRCVHPLCPSEDDYTVVNLLCQECRQDPTHHNNCQCLIC